MKQRYIHIIFGMILGLALNSGTIRAQEIYTDIDGNEYGTVTIGDLVWTTVNLRVVRFANGDTIPIANAYADWNTISHTNGEAARASFRESDFFSDNFGFLYNYYATTDPRGIANEGWRIPTEDDWKALETSVGMPEADLERTAWGGADQMVGAKLRSISTDFWEASDVSTSYDEFGFSWVAGSVRYSDGTFETEVSAYRFGALWSADEDAADSTRAWRRLARYDRDDLRRNTVPKGTGHHIRLVRDASATSNELNQDSPQEFGLSQNFPNPFNPTTLIYYSVPVSGEISIKVFDLLGREISNLYEGVQTSGTHSVSFNASNISSGIYIYQLRSNHAVITKRMTLLK